MLFKGALEMLKSQRIPLAICAVTFLVWTTLLFYKYDHLGYYDWDLAFFTQACWQLLHGSQYTSVTGINYFGDHSYIITFLTLPFFALVPHPLTLVMLKLTAFIVAAYLFYKIAYEALGESTALILMVLYILFPANIFSILYEYNPESFAPPFLFWMFMAFQKKQWRSFFVASVLLMLIKENMCLFVCVFGLYGLFRKDCPPKIAWSSIFLGAAVFYAMSIVVVPYFRHLTYHPFVVRYAYLGHSVGEIIFNVFAQPQKIVHAVFTSLNGRYIQALFGPLLLPALISWQILFLAFPILLQHLLSVEPPEHSIYYHYGETIAPFIFLAVMCTLRSCRQRFSGKIFNMILVLLIALSLANLYDYRYQFRSKLDYHFDHLDAMRWAFVDAVPPHEGVIATFDYLSPLALRDQLYAFHKVYDESYQDPKAIEISELNTGKSFILPDQVHYALIDFEDPWLQNEYMLMPPVISQRIQSFLVNSHWKIIKRYGSIVLMRR